MLGDWVATYILFIKKYLDNQDQFEKDLEKIIEQIFEKTTDDI